MDFTKIINMLQMGLGYLAAFFIFIATLKSARFKGVLGEWLVNILIKIFLDKQVYHLIKDVTLETNEGTTQIDHIIVSQFGIFVIETKNMKGWIYGGAGQKTWTQKIFKHTTKFQNPLHQNYKHIKTLESHLSIDKGSIFSVIIFIGDSTFKTTMPDNVQYARGGIKYIKSKTTHIFTDDEVEQIITQIESGRLRPGFKTNRQHIKHVKALVKRKSDSQICKK